MAVLNPLKVTLTGRPSDVRNVTALGICYTQLFIIIIITITIRFPFQS